VEISADENPLACHDIIDQIEQDVREKFGVDLVIHCDPIPSEDEEWTEMRTLTDRIVKEIDMNIIMHDFRMKRKAEGTELVFDLEIPYGLEKEYGFIEEKIKAELLKNEKNCTVSIHFDGKE